MVATCWFNRRDLEAEKAAAEAEAAEEGSAGSAGSEGSKDESEIELQELEPRPMSEDSGSGSK